MRRGTIFTYRFLGTFVALMAYMAFFTSIVRLFGIGLYPRLMINIFVSACMVIYSTLSRLFSQVVLKEEKPLRRSLKDWLVANAAVVIVGVAYGIFKLQQLMLSPAILQQILDSASQTAAQRHLPNVYTPDTVHSMMVISIIFASTIIAVGIVHAVWTLFLVKRYKDFFQ